MTKYKWISIMPLIGGMSLGTEKAFGYKPEFLMGYPGINNDLSIKQRWSDIPFLMIDTNENKIQNDYLELFKKKNKNIDVVCGVPVCSGLSMLNAGGHADPTQKRGSDASQNEWMYRLSNFTLKEIKPKAAFFENAPGLYTEIGKGVVEKLNIIAKENGYSFSIIKTNTNLHGIPQHRPRSFYFFWKSPTAPILNYYNVPRKPFTEFIVETDFTGLKYHDTDKAFDFVKNDAIFQFVKGEYGDNFRQHMIDNKKKSMFQLIDADKRFEDLRLYCKSIGHKTEKNIEFIQEKLSRDLGYWDWSLQVHSDYTSAVISKNMDSFLHPIEDRLLTLRECMYMMGLPNDFELAVDRERNVICQNVPVCTAKDMTLEVIKFLNGELEMSDSRFIKQNNTTRKTEFKEMESNSLDSLF